jgi:hypothetical protein
VEARVFGKNKIGCKWWNKWFGDHPEPDPGPVVDAPHDVQKAYEKLLNQANALHAKVNLIERGRSQSEHDAIGELLKGVQKEGVRHGRG